VSAYWNGGFGNSIFFNMGQLAPCPVCTAPENIVMQVAKLIDLLEDARKITHPDVCDNEKATDVTARINAFITEVRLRKRDG
jgi:hypothetical protein